MGKPKILKSQKRWWPQQHGLSTRQICQNRTDDWRQMTDMECQTIDDKYHMEYMSSYGTVRGCGTCTCTKQLHVVSFTTLVIMDNVHWTSETMSIGHVAMRKVIWTCSSLRGVSFTSWCRNGQLLVIKEYLCIY